MSSQPIEANVVLSTDNSQYDSAMNSSAMATDNFGKSVDSLGAKINNLAKSAGKKMLGISAADVAVIGGATAAWASYEKQIARLQAQAAIVSRSRTQETLVLKQYTDSVKGLRSEFGVTTTEAAALTQQVSKLADQTQSIKSLSDTFERMSMATGESSTGLANSLLNLQKIMGTPQTQTKQYADQLTYLAAKSNTSATALAEFTSQIAPMGRAMGMSQTQVTGFSNMFIKAGQDGYTAASAFNKVAQDITYAVQTGSPDMLKYANVLGVTVSQFKQMSGAEQVAGFLDQISKMGPRAAMELNRFGFDGIRMAKALTATVQSSGGAMNALNEAQAGYGSDATDKGAAAAESMSTTLSKLRQDLQQTGESFGKAFGPGIDKALKVIEMLASGFQNLMNGPLGKFIQVMSYVVIPVTAAAGALLLLAGTLVKLSAAFMLVRGSPGLGFMEGLRGGSRMVPEEVNGVRTGNFVAAGGGMLGRRGAQIAEGGTYGQRFMYNSGQQLGGTIRGGFGFLGGIGRGEEGGPNIWSRGTSGAIRFGSSMFNQQFDAMRYSNPADRTQFLGRYFGDRGPQVNEAMTARTAAEQRLTGAQATHYSVMGAQGATEDQKTAAKQAVTDAKAEAIAAKKAEEATVARAAADMKAAEQTAASSKMNEGVYRTMRAEGARVAESMAAAAAGAAKFAASTAASGLARAGGGLMSVLGGPVGVGLTAAMFLPMLIPMVKKLFGHDSQSPYEYAAYTGNTYLKNAGGTLPASYSPSLNASEQQNLTVSRALSVNKRSIAAGGPSYTLANKVLSGMSETQATTFLGADYNSVKNNPQALYSMKEDLIHEFGGQGAERVLASLAAGDYGTNAGVFWNATAGSSSHAAVNQALQFGAIQTNRSYQTHGEKGGARTRANVINQAFQAALQPGADVSAIVTGLNAQYGLGLDASTFTSVASRVANPQLSGGYRAYNPTVTAANKALAAGVGSSNTTTQFKTMLEQLPPAAMPGMLKALGLDPTLTGDAAINAIVGAQSTTGGKSPFTTSSSLEATVRRTGPAGRMFEGSDQVQAALGFGAHNVGANVAAINSMMDKMHDAGMAAPQITRAMGDIQSHFDPSDPNYILAGMVSSQAQQQLGLQMPNMTRAQGFSTQVAMFNQVSGIKPVTDEQFQNQQDAKAQMAQAMTDQESYFKQMLLMQNQYEIGRARAQYDYNLQRGYEEHDFHLQRSRAEASFNRQRGYAVADYYRSVNRAQYQFDLSRSRSEADFNHQVEIQTKQAAMSVFDIYHRVATERTSSASALLSNAADQLRRMREQERDLNKLRGMGLSNNAIQQLKLTDPANQQQLARFVTEMTPQMIQQFNKTAGTERLKAAKSLVTDQSSLEWREMRRGFNLQQSRAAQDFNYSQEKGREDFMRGLGRQRHEFNISMDQQSTDFETQMNRQEAQYVLSMKRAAEDLANVGKEIDGSFEQILTRSVNSLTGHAKAQAKAVLASFKDLKNNSEPEAVALMKSLAEIFGFKYTPPKGVHATSLGEQHMQNEGPHANGGIIPGWTPGRDTTTASVSGGEAIMRPEWARAVGEGAINAMNHRGQVRRVRWWWDLPAHQ
jgi:TP901 family phage tail tape measure protein